MLKRPGTTKRTNFGPVAARRLRIVLTSADPHTLLQDVD